MSAIAPSFQWQDQHNRVERFVGRFEPSYRLLIYHAALPLVLTPELLNYLRTQFLPREQVPWIAEVDLLLSDLCHPVGYELYAMDTDIRAYVLAEIQNDAFWQQRMREVAQVLISYVNHLSQMHPGQRQGELQAQRWAAMVYLGDESCRSAVREIAERLQQSSQAMAQDAGCDSQVRAELARLSRITHELEPQLRHNESLVAYARLVQRVLRSPQTIHPLELQQSFEVEGIELRITDALLADPAVPSEPPGEDEALAGFPPLTSLEFESATILILPPWKQGILDDLRDWVSTFNQLKKMPASARRVVAYQEKFQMLISRLQEPELSRVLEHSMEERSRLLTQPGANLQPDDFQRTQQLLSAFLRRQTDTILPDQLPRHPPDFPPIPDLTQFQEQLQAFAADIPTQLEASKHLPRQAKIHARQVLERSFLQAVGGLALVVVSDSLAPQDAAKALVLGYVLLVQGMEARWQPPEAIPSLPSPTPPALDLTTLPTLTPFTFTVATLHDASGAWQINRTHHQAQHLIEDLGLGISLDMVAIPGGEFLMGNPDEDPDTSASDGPQHWVSVPAFLMGRYPITQAQWRIVATWPPVNRPLPLESTHIQGDDYPIREVSWYEAVEFCDRLSRQTRRPYRLPTEAEWEYACRAGTTTPFHFGDTLTSNLANYNGTHTYGHGPQGEYRRETTPVGYFGVANVFGLVDMHGNVSEWCLDPWHDNYEGAPEDGSVWAAPQERRRIVRGGCWFSRPHGCVSFCRGIPMEASEGNLDIGFRVVCDIKPEGNR